MDNNKIKIRLEFEGEIRICECPNSYQNLCLRAKRLFLLNEDDIKDLQFTYCDEEGDKVNVSNFYDLEQALIYADKEKLKILDLKLIITIDYDIINATTNSIKLYDDKEILFLKKDAKPNYLNCKDYNVLTESSFRKFKDLVSKKMSKEKSDLILNLLQQAKNYQFVENIDDVRKNKINNLNYDKIFIDEKSTLNNSSRSLKDLLDDFEIKEIIKKVIEEEIESIKQRIVQKSIMKANQMISHRMKTQTSLNIIPNSIKCRGCLKIIKNGCIYICTICEDFKFCNECEQKSGKDHKHPLIKIRNLDDINKNHNFKENKVSLFIDSKHKDTHTKNKKENNFENAKRINYKFDPTKLNEKLLSELLKNTKGNIDKVLNFIIK